MFSVRVPAQSNKTAKFEDDQKALTARQVLDKYYEALGGKQNLENVKSVIIEEEIFAKGNITSVITRRMGNKLKVTTKNARGKEKYRVFDGEKGFTSEDGHRKEITAGESRDLISQKTIEALELDKSNVFLDRLEVEDIEGRKYNVLSSHNGKYYFDVKTGLLFKTVLGNIETFYKKYVFVNGIKFFTTKETVVGGNKIIYKIKNITLNSGISEKEFN